MGRERRERRNGTRTVAPLAGVVTTQGEDEGDPRMRWAAASSRFRAFVAEHESKIAKKLRNADGAEGRRDLMLELYAAHRLLLDRRFTVEYERFTAGKTRGPDFSVLFKTRTPFNVEVKRLRATGAGDFNRWAFVVCDKLGQMPPSAINVLLMGAEDGAGGAAAAGAEVARAMARLHTLAERKDDEFFVKRGLLGAKDYVRQLSRLSAVLYIAGWERAEDGDGDGAVSLWVNPQAKHPLPDDLARALA